MLFTTLLLPILSLTAAIAAPAPRDINAGNISAPLSGTHISPGQQFDFQYTTHADYSVSSYNFDVWLVTEPPTSMAPSDVFMKGYWFGRFQEENYPAVPYPTNPAPAQLTMPDLSKPEGGFGAGATAVNDTFYIAVVEMWDDGEGSLGNKISLAFVDIIYNATQS